MTSTRFAQLFAIFLLVVGALVLTIDFAVIAFTAPRVVGVVFMLLGVANCYYSFSDFKQGRALKMTWRRFTYYGGSEEFVYRNARPGSFWLNLAVRLVIFVTLNLSLGFALLLTHNPWSILYLLGTTTL